MAAAVHKLGHIVPAGQLEGAGELAVKRVFHDNVHHGAAIVHHSVQLCLHACLVMADSYPAGETDCGGILQAVPPGGG